MIDEIRKVLSDYKIVKITKMNFQHIIEVYNSNQKFFLLTEGEEATLEKSIKDVNAVPPNFNIKNKIYVGIWENYKIIGVLDLLLGYPKKQSVWIGLLLVHGSLHGKKFGSKILTGVLEAAKTTGYKTAQLGVIDNNKQGIEFWQKHGFEKIRESEIKNNEKTLKIIVMERQLVL